jgi:hypothetical protein
MTTIMPLSESGKAAWPPLQIEVDGEDHLRRRPRTTPEKGYGQGIDALAEGVHRLRAVAAAEPLLERGRSPPGR